MGKHKRVTPADRKKDGGSTRREKDYLEKYEDEAGKRKRIGITETRNVE